MPDFDYAIGEVRKCLERSHELVSDGAVEGDGARDEALRVQHEALVQLTFAVRALAEHSSMPREVPER